jgi:hypothetical protein
MQAMLFQVKRIIRRRLLRDVIIADVILSRAKDPKKLSEHWPREILRYTQNDKD